MTAMPPSSSTSSNIPARFGKAIVTGAAKVVPIRKARGVAASPVGPQPGEQPAFNLKVQVCSCKDLLAMDSNGKSDPCVFPPPFYPLANSFPSYVVVSFLRKREKTPYIKATLDPVYPPKDATFEFPVFLSLAETMGALELIVWDKDMIGSDYLGEVALPIQDWFQGQPLLFDDPVNEVG
jgi:phosphatidylserine decarboxylase